VSALLPFLNYFVPFLLFFVVVGGVRVSAFAGQPIIRIHGPSLVYSTLRHAPRMM
jgi:hypothetical protein